MLIHPHEQRMYWNTTQIDIIESRYCKQKLTYIY